jgi:hypothetical protein
VNGAQNGAGSAILAELAKTNAKLDALMKHFGLGASGQTSAGGATNGGEVGDAKDIEGQYGDPKIGRMPKNWKGDNFEGKRASQCTPEFLDFWANFLDWKADNPRAGKEQYAKNDRRDARRCRRWALEIREGRVRQEAPPDGGYPSDWDNDGPPAARPTPRSAGSAPPADWEDQRGDW